MKEHAQGHAAVGDDLEVMVQTQACRQLTVLPPQGPQPAPTGLPYSLSLTLVSRQSVHRCHVVTCYALFQTYL